MTVETLTKKNLNLVAVFIVIATDQKLNFFKNGGAQVTAQFFLKKKMSQKFKKKKSAEKPRWQTKGLVEPGFP